MKDLCQTIYENRQQQIKKHQFESYSSEPDILDKDQDVSFSNHFEKNNSQRDEYYNTNKQSNKIQNDRKLYEEQNFSHIKRLAKLSSEQKIQQYLNFFENKSNSNQKSQHIISQPQYKTDFLHAALQKTNQIKLIAKLNKEDYKDSNFLIKENIQCQNKDFQSQNQISAHEIKIYMNENYLKNTIDSKIRQNFQINTNTLQKRVVQKLQKIKQQPLKSQQNNYQKSHCRRSFAFSFLQLIKIYSEVLFQQNIQLVHEQNFYIQQIFASKCSYIMTFQIQISYFKIKVDVYNLPIFQNYFDQYVDAYGQFIGSGAGGKIHALPNVKGVVKRVPLMMNGYLDSAFMKNILKQYAICKLLSCFQIGPKILKPFGFDIICSCSHLAFFMEQCLSSSDKLDLKNQEISLSYLKIQQDLKRALFLLHKLQIIHFDIKPQNVMYSQQYKKMVFIDFGLAQYKIFPHSITEQQSFKGTYFYSSDSMRSLLHLGVKGHVDVYYNDVFCLTKTLKVIQSRLNLLDPCKNMIISLDQDNAYNCDKIQNLQHNHLLHDSDYLNLNQFNDYFIMNKMTKKQLNQAQEKEQCILNSKQNYQLRNSYQKTQLIILTYFIFKNKEQDLQIFVKTHQKWLEKQIDQVINIFYEMEQNFIINQIFDKYFSKAQDFLSLKQRNKFQLIKSINHIQKSKIKVNTNRKIKDQTLDNYLRATYQKLNKNSSKNVALRYKFSLNDIIPKMSISAYKRTILKLQNFKQNKESFYTHQQLQKHYILHDYIQFLCTLAVNNFEQTQSQILIKQSYAEIDLYLLKLRKVSSFFQKNYKQFNFHSTNQVNFLKLVSYSIQNAYNQLKNNEIFERFMDYPQSEQIFIRIYVPLTKICIHYNMKQNFHQLNCLQIARLKRFIINEIEKIINYFSKYQEQARENESFNSSQKDIQKIEATTMNITYLFHYIFNSSLTQVIQEQQANKIVAVVTAINSFQQFIALLREIYHPLIKTLNNLVSFNSKKENLDLRKFKSFNPLLIYINTEQANDLIDFFNQISQLFILNFINYPHGCSQIIQKVIHLQNMIVKQNLKNNKLFFTQKKSENVVMTALRYIKYKCLHKIGNYSQAINILEGFIAPYKVLAFEGRQKDFILSRLKYYKDLFLIYREIFQYTKSSRLESFVNHHFFNAKHKDCILKQSSLQDFVNQKKLNSQQNIQSLSCQNSSNINLKAVNKQNFVNENLESLAIHSNLESFQNYPINSAKNNLKDDILCNILKMVKQYKIGELDSQCIYKLSNFESIYQNFDFAKETVIHQSFNFQNIFTLVEVIQIIQEAIIQRTNQLEIIFKESFLRNDTKFFEKQSIVKDKIFPKRFDVESKHILSYYFELIYLQDELINKIENYIEFIESQRNKSIKYINRKDMLQKIIVIRNLKTELIKKYIDTVKNYVGIKSQQRKGLKYNFSYYICLYKLEQIKLTSFNKQIPKIKSQVISMTRSFINFLCQQLGQAKNIYKSQKTKINRTEIIHSLINIILTDPSLNEVQFIVDYLILPVSHLLNNQNSLETELKQYSSKTNHFDRKTNQNLVHSSKDNQQMIFQLTNIQFSLFSRKLCSFLQQTLIQSKKISLFLVSESVLKFGEVIVTIYLKQKRYTQLIVFINKINQELNWLSNQFVFERFYIIYVNNTVLRMSLISNNHINQYKHYSLNINGQSISDGYLNFQTYSNHTLVSNLIQTFMVIKNIISFSNQVESEVQIIKQGTSLLLINFLFQLVDELSKILMKNRINQKIKKQLALIYLTLSAKTKEQGDTKIQIKNDQINEILFSFFYQILKIWKLIAHKYFRGAILKIRKKIKLIKYEQHLALVFQLQNSIFFKTEDFQKRANKIFKLTKKSNISLLISSCQNITIFHSHFVSKLQKAYANKAE